MSKRRHRAGALVVIAVTISAIAAAAWSGAALASTTQPAGHEGPQPLPSIGKVSINAVPVQQFNMATLKVDIGGPATVHFLNQDPYGPHSFSVYTDSSATTPLAAGSTGSPCSFPCSYDLVFTPPAPGSYYFQCDVHGAAMSGAFVVSAPAPPTATPTPTTGLAVGGIGTLPDVPPGDGGGGLGVVAGTAALAVLAATFAGAAWRLRAARR